MFGANSPDIARAHAAESHASATSVASTARGPTADRPKRSSSGSEQGEHLDPSWRFPGGGLEAEDRAVDAPRPRGRRWEGCVEVGARRGDDDRSGRQPQSSEQLVYGGLDRRWCVRVDVNAQRKRSGRVATSDRPSGPRTGRSRADRTQLPRPRRCARSASVLRRCPRIRREHIRAEALRRADGRCPRTTRSGGGASRSGILTCQLDCASRAGIASPCPRDTPAAPAGTTTVA